MPVRLRGENSIITRACILLLALALILASPNPSIAADPTVPEAYGSVERVLSADETGVAIPVSVA